MIEAAQGKMAVYNPRPTVRVDGRASERLTKLLLAMEYVEREGGPSSMELRFSNVATDLGARGSLAFEDGSELSLGKSISVAAGDAAAPRELFAGTISGLEASFSQDAPPELVALAEDALQAARMARRTAVHEQASIAALAAQVARRAGLTAVVLGFSEDLGLQVQWNESDLGFLQRLLASRDGDAQVVGRELHVSPRAEIERGVLELPLNARLVRARFLADLAHQVNEVTVAGWNPQDGSRARGSSRGRDLGPGEGRPGSEVLGEAFAERSEHLGHLAVLDNREAEALAQAAFDRRARRFVTVEGTCEGDARLRVGTHVRISGAGPRFSNVYYVDEARHRFDSARGYQVDFRAQCAFLGRRP